MNLTKLITDNKDKLSTVFAFLMVAYEPLNSYFMDKPFEWKTFLFLLYGSIVSFSIGKYPRNLVNGNSISASTETKIEDKGYATTQDLKTKE